LDIVVLYLQELTADIAAVSGAAAADSDLHTPSLEPTTQTTAYVKVRPTLIFHQFFIAGVTEAVTVYSRCRLLMDINGSYT
jgi:hypothetical protein